MSVHKDGQRKGRESEDRFERLLSSRLGVPDWIVAVRASEDDDHRQGIDFYVMTADGVTIPVDVKSSMKRRNKVRRSGPDRVCPIVIRAELDDPAMLAQIIQVLQKWKSQHPE